MDHYMTNYPTIYRKKMMECIIHGWWALAIVYMQEIQYLRKN